MFHSFIHALDFFSSCVFSSLVVQYDDDYEDDDEDYEDDEAPRKRRKPKKPVNLIPKPKGAPRNYVVCKDCPTCHLKVGNNTRVCRGCGHLFSNVKEHAPRARTSLESTPSTNPDGTPLQARKSGRKRTRNNPANSFDYLDKDEAAHLQIALQNSCKRDAHTYMRKYVIE